MSNIINKVKEAVTGHHSSSSEPEGTHGTHNSRAANAADPRIDSDRDHRAAPGNNEYTSGTSGLTGSHHTGTTGTTGSSGLTGSHGTIGTTGYDSAREGPHSSNLANKLDPTIDSDRSGKHLGNTAGDHHGSGAEGVHGPHSSRIANAADPRVDSDRDASRTVGNTYGSSGTHGTTGAHSTTGTSHGTTEGAHGPHGSRVANALDPRVDSDRDGSKTVGNTQGSSGTYGTTGTHGSSGTYGGNTGTYGSTGTYDGTTEGAHGPHSSRVVNAADPRVDSDRDGSRTVGNTHGTSGAYGTTGTHGSSGTYGTSGTTHGTTEGVHGPHSSRVANAADPRVDSDRDGSRTVGNTHGTSGAYGTTGTHGTSGAYGTTGTHGTSGTTHGTSHVGSGAHAPGPAPHTAGPHKSDALNKADPRVDSDLDGSKTVGGNKTYAA